MTVNVFFRNTFLFVCDKCFIPTFTITCTYMSGSGGDVGGVTSDKVASQ